MKAFPPAFRCVFALAALALSACRGGGSSLPTVSNAPSGQAASAARAAASVQADWDSWGYDLQHTGYNPKESIVGTGNVGTLHKLWSVNVGTVPMPEPVYASGVMVNGTPVNVLYTGSNGGAALYAINADTGAVLWTHPVPSITASCGSSSLHWSIGATAAIDRGKNLIYFGDGDAEVQAVDLSTGSAALGWPIKIAGYPAHNHMHGGLTYNPANGMLYAETSSMCGDRNPWYGRIVAINTKTHAIVHRFFPASGTSKATASGGGIWGGGGGSIDPATNGVIIATGNADTSTGLAQNAAYSEDVVMLSANVGTVLQYNYPGNISTSPGDDNDFGATPMIFQPPGCPEMTAALNKSGMFELYEVSSIGTGPVQYVQMSIEANDVGDFQGSPAYDPVTNLVYVGLPATYGIYNSGLAAFSIRPDCTINPTPVWNASFGPDGSMISTEEMRSAITIANGVVYVGNGYGNTYYAFNAATGTRLWSTSVTKSARAGIIVANGNVYVSGGDGTITAWAPQ